MRKYATNASSELRLAYGQELIIGLRVIDDTAPLADALQEVQETLETRLDERLAFRRPALGAVLSQPRP